MFMPIYPGNAVPAMSLNSWTDLAVPTWRLRITARAAQGTAATDESSKAEVQATASKFENSSPSSSEMTKRRRKQQ